MKINKEIKKQIKAIIKSLPKEIDERLPYELMVYTYVDKDGRTDFNDFDYFEGIGKLNKAIETVNNTTNFINQAKTEINLIKNLNINTGI